MDLKPTPIAGVLDQVASHDRRESNGRFAVLLNHLYFEAHFEQDQGGKMFLPVLLTVQNLAPRRLQGIE